MGLISFFFNRSGTGKRLAAEKAHLKQKLAAARDEVAGLRVELKTAAKQRGQAPPRSTELEAGLAAALSCRTPAGWPPG